VGLCRLGMGVRFPLPWLILQVREHTCDQKLSGVDLYVVLSLGLGVQFPMPWLILQVRVHTYDQKLSGVDLYVRP